MTFSGQMFAMTPMTQMKKTPTAIYRTYRRTSFQRRRFLRFWTIKLTFITFASKNQYFVVDWSRRVFSGEKVNWPAAYSWITLDSQYMATISAATYLRMRLTSEYIRYMKSTSKKQFRTWTNDLRTAATEISHSTRFTLLPMQRTQPYM